MSLKTPTYEAVEVGETFGPLVLDVDDHFVKSYAFALDDYCPWHMREPSPFGGRLAPAAGVAKKLLHIFMTKYDPNALVGLHQKEEIWYHAPVRFGSRVTLTARYVDKYVRRGKGYVVLDGEAHDADGNLLVRQRSTEIMRVPDKVELGAGGAGPEGRRVTGAWPRDREPAPSAAAVMAPGTPVGPLVKRVHQDQMSVFCGAEEHWRNIHTDLDVARRAGFPDTLAPGMMEACWLSEMLTGFFGPDFLTGGWMQVAFLRPVLPGDSIVCKGLVTELTEDDSGRRLQLEVWAENAEGNMTVAGWAANRHPN